MKIIISYLHQSISKDICRNGGKIDFVDLQNLYFGFLRHHFEQLLHLEPRQLGLAQIDLSNIVHYHSQLARIQPGETVEAEVEDPQGAPPGDEEISESHSLEMSEVSVLQSGLSQLGNCSVNHNQ